jgi:hypothetical protein
MKIIFIILILIIPVHLTSEDESICFTKEQVKAISDQLDKDKKIIRWQARRWNELVNTKPKVHYKTKGKKIVIQKLEFPIKNDKPLIYKIEFEVTIDTKKYTYFPLRINLGIMIESGAVKFNYIDPKFGLQFLGFEPLKIKFIKGIGFHILIGIQSAGLSISWGWMKKPVENLRIHFYGGVTYEAEKTFGGGLTLNF